MHFLLVILNVFCFPLCICIHVTYGCRITFCIHHFSFRIDNNKAGIYQLCMMVPINLNSNEPLFLNTGE